MPVLEYFTSRKSKKEEHASAPKTPVLTDDDQEFLQRITSEEPPPLPARPIVILDNGKKLEGRDAQLALMDGADQIALPQSPPAVEEAPALPDRKKSEKEIKKEEKKLEKEDKKQKKEEEKHDKDDKKKGSRWSFIPSLPGRSKDKGKEKETAATDLHSAAESLKTGEPVDLRPAGPHDDKEDAKELSAVLDQLNISAVNNRAFSFSKESQELMEKFTLILKDIINGVPTAYDDLEKLLTGSEKQLGKLFAAMPPFLQTLVKNLPAKMTNSLGPELMAAASAGPSMSTTEAESSKDGKKKSKRGKVPSVKRLVTEQGAVTSMLKSILNFLKLRFPAVMTGTNVIMSLAVFLLLFVFWYCHKRGKETRLEKEKLAAGSAEVSEDDIEEGGSSGGGRPDIESPIHIKDDPMLEEKPSAALQDLPSVVDLPDPSEENAKREPMKEEK